MAGAELHDLGALSELRAALVRFREQTRDVPDLLRQRTSRARQDIARRHHLLTAMIAELESEDETEDSDQAERERQLDRLRHQLGRVEACEATLDAAAGAHDLALRQWHPVMERTLPSAIAFLSSKHAEAVESLRVALPGTGAASRHQGLKYGVMVRHRQPGPLLRKLRDPARSMPGPQTNCRRCLRALSGRRSRNSINRNSRGATTSARA